MSAEFCSQKEEVQLNLLLLLFNSLKSFLLPKKLQS